MRQEKSLALKNLLLALLVMALWGSLFPMIKIGYRAFDIDTSAIPDIIVFASMRFIVSGIAVCLIAWLKKAPIARPFRKSLLPIFLAALFTVFLHYICTYVGLSVADSSKTALLKQTGPLLYVCFAFLFLREEKFSLAKLAGALVGFLGIVAINFGTAGISFAFGDLIVLAASVFSVAGTVCSKKGVSSASPFWVTGISQLVGGVALLAVGLVLGGKFPAFSLSAALVFLYICTASVCAYLLHAYVQKTESNSRLLIIKFAEPLFACVFGWMLLGEDIWRWQYLVAFLLVSCGILLGSYRKEGKE